MRLINIFTGAMESFFGADIPTYGILSHCWGDHEVSLKEYLADQKRGRHRQSKVADFCLYLRNLARRHVDPESDRTNVAYERDRMDGAWDKAPQSHRGEIEWAWIDTCCIDKESSAELSEAINSMYQWYHSAALCVAYLADVAGRPRGQGSNSHGRSVVTNQDIESSRWFRRGWTLQELIAPRRLVFVSADWQHIGVKGKEATSSAREMSFVQRVSDITGIPMSVLVLGNVLSRSIAQRLSWMANRDTTREEDTAYCLLGLLNIHMPLLYGEGRHAWTRLQQEIIKTSNDETVFAWGRDNHFRGDILSDHPTKFALSAAIESYAVLERLPYSITNQGLEIKLKAKTAFVAPNQRSKTLLIPLNCCSRSSRGELQPFLLVLRRRDECGHYDKVMCDNAEVVHAAMSRLWLEELIDCKKETIYVHLFPTRICITQLTGPSRYNTSPAPECTIHGIRAALRNGSYGPSILRDTNSGSEDSYVSSAFADISRKTDRFDEKHH